METCEKTNCIVCDKEMDKYPLYYNNVNKKYYRSNKETKFCSRSCIAKSNKVNVSGNCIVCEKPYIITVNKPFAYKVKYCSKECHKEFERLKYRKSVYHKKIQKEKVCVVCNTEFVGKVISSVTCSKKCHKENHVRRRQKRLSEFKQKLINKKGGKCCKCGNLYDMAAMVFHHNTGIKNFHLARDIIYKYSKEIIEKELELVSLMCQNCHVEEHERERAANQKPIKQRSIEMKEEGKERKRKLIKLKGGCCQKCGYKSNYLSSMTFDHIGEKTFHLSACRLSKPWDIILKEVDNCELLCLNCHMTKNNLANNKRKIPINSL